MLCMCYILGLSVIHMLIYCFQECGKLFKKECFRAFGRGSYSWAFFGENGGELLTI